MFLLHPFMLITALCNMQSTAAMFGHPPWSAKTVCSSADGARASFGTRRPSSAGSVCQCFGRGLEPIFTPDLL